MRNTVVINNYWDAFGNEVDSSMNINKINNINKSKLK